MLHRDWRKRPTGEQIVQIIREYMQADDFEKVLDFEF